MPAEAVTFLLYTFAFFGGFIVTLGWVAYQNHG
jgi:hypothetical protein